MAILSLNLAARSQAALESTALSRPKTVLAFSGGLDTTYCAVWLREQGHDVHALTVQTGGFDAAELAGIEQRARQAGVAAFEVVDARQELFDDILRHLIFANALRGGVYPLCVSAERVVQARRCAQHALRIGATALCHGSTGAGNDQVRFDVAFRVLAPELAILTPIREQALSREQEVAYLAARGIHIPPKTAVYSVNRGLWGTTIGGGQTHHSDGELPESAWCLTAGPSQRPAEAEDCLIEFRAGVPTALDGRARDGVALVEELNARGARHGFGRGIHVGDTIIGIKGRIAFEAPGPLTLIAAHRELEKLVLSRQQQFWKATLGDLYGAFLHEARYFDPLMRDVEAFLASSQRRVTGAVRIRWRDGQCTVVGASSPHSLMSSDLATYGEGTRLWSGAEAAGFARLLGMQEYLLARQDQRANATAAAQ